MKKMLLTTMLLISSNAYALEECPSDLSLLWDNCFGTYNFDEGEFAGHKYIGYWKNDNFHGQGIYTTTEGDKYSGQFLEGYKSGQGTYIWKDGDKYSGQFLNDSPNGIGTYEFISGDSYKGEVKDYSFQGQGTYIWKNGDKYSGQFLNDSANGIGTYEFISGDSYKGEVKDYSFQGQGTYIFANGNIEAGIWENDKLASPDPSNLKDNNNLETSNEVFNTIESSSYMYGVFFVLFFTLYLLYIYTKNKQISKIEIRTLSKAKVVFKGSIRDYYPIWITNIVLMVITLGIYSPWAKVRNMKYFYQNTSIDGHIFDYTAKPIQILKGRVIAVTVLLLYFLLVSIYDSFSIILPIALVFLTPWLINQSMRFNMRVTTYRNIRFNFVGDYFESFTRFILYPILVILTLYIAAPRMHKSINNYIINNTEFGSKKFTTDQKTSTYYNAFALSGLFIVLMIICIYFFANILGTNSGEIWAIIGIGLYIALFISGPIYQSQIRNSIYNNSCIDNTVYFKSSLTARGHVFLIFTNILLVIATLGLAIPWVKIRNAKYFAHLTNVYFDTEVESIIQKESKDGSVLADEIGDAFDIDVSLG